MSDVHGERRRALMDRMGDGVAVLWAAPETYRNNDVHYEYRQDSDFWYLTGFREPDAVLVLRPGQTPETVMFVRPRDPSKEVWNGIRAGPEGVVANLGIAAAHAIEALDAELPKYLDSATRLHYALGRAPRFERHALAWVERARNPRSGKDRSAEIVDVAPILHEMRLRKRPEEVASLRRAGAVTAEAHLAAMRVVRPGIRESDLQAVFEYVCRRRGALRLGYPCIVGAGPHATVLHYNDNDGVIRDGDLVLVDAGCEVDCYTADLTRTYPASGRFTPPQRALYEVVLDAQLAAIDLCRVGRSFQDVHDAAVRALVEGMLRVGLMTGDVDDVIANQKHARYYMHRTSHWLGLDVHDVGRYAAGGAPRALEPDHVLTVEPGIYVSANDEEAPERFRGIGIRIEDDVRVTPEGPEVLTAAAPKAPDDLERETSRRLALPGFD